MQSTKGQPSSSTCRACDRTFAMISLHGDLIPTSTRELACDTCRPFEELHKNVKAKDAAFAEVEGRRSEHGGRMQALEESRTAHKALQNFLIQVEKFQETQPVQTPSQPDPTPTSPVSHDQHGQKRTLTPSSVPRAKRRRLEDEKRRVSFDVSVVFHDEEDSRPYQVFNRVSEVYVPGRNAPSDPQGFLDTSGYGIAPGRFFGVRKHKKGWIETKEGKEMDEWWWGRDEQDPEGDLPMEKNDEGLKTGEDVGQVSEGGRPTSRDVAESETAGMREEGLEISTRDRQSSPGGQPPFLSDTPREVHSRPETPVQHQDGHNSDVPTTSIVENMIQQSLQDGPLEEEGRKAQAYESDAKEMLPSGCREQSKLGLDESLQRCEIQDQS